MPKISDMQKPALPLSGLEMLPALQGGGVGSNVGVPMLAYGGLPNGNVLALRVPMAADLSATSDANPGAGNVRWNNANPGLATVLYVNDADTDAGSLTSVWAALTVGGFVYVQASADSGRRDVWQKWQVTSITDTTGYAKIGVSLRGGNGAFVDDEPVEFTAQQPSSSPGINRNVTTVITSTSGVLTLDASLGDYFVTTLFENVTNVILTNVPQGCSLMLRVMQSASTARTITWPSTFRWADGVKTVSTTLGARDRIAMSTDDYGGSWDATIARGFVP